MSAAPSSRPRLWQALFERLSGFELSPALRRPLRLAGYPLFAIVVALISFAIALPRDKVRERLEDLLSQDPTASQPMGLGVDVKAGDLTLSVLGRGIHADNVVLRTRPLRANDKPARFVLDGVNVNVGLIGLLMQRPTYSFVIEAFGGGVEGGVRVATLGNNYAIEAREIGLAAIQGLQTAIGGLPLEGKLEGKLELDAPGRMLSSSSGSLELTIDGVSLGDGKAKLVIPNDPFLAGGLTVPRVRLGKLNATITIDKGRARIDSLRAHSADLDLTIEGSLDLRDPFPSTALHLFIRIKLSDELLKREPTLGLLTTGLAPGKRPDGFFGMQLTGSFATPRFEPGRNPPQGVTSKFSADAVAASAAGSSAATSPSPPPLPAGGSVPPPSAPEGVAPGPTEIPPPERPTTLPKEGIVPPPPALRGATRVVPPPGEPARGAEGAGSAPSGEEL